MAFEKKMASDGDMAWLVDASYTSGYVALSLESQRLKLVLWTESSSALLSNRGRSEGILESTRGHLRREGEKEARVG